MTPYTIDITPAVLIGLAEEFSRLAEHTHRLDDMNFFIAQSDAFRAQAAELTRSAN